MMNEEIDRLMVEHIMGGFVSDPDALADVGEVWYWLHPKDGVLRGEPYQFKRNRAWDHQWERWQPSRDISAAWQVVERFGIRHGPSLYQIGLWYCNFLVDGERIEASASTAAMSICLAALKAVGVEVAQ